MIYSQYFSSKINYIQGIQMLKKGSTSKSFYFRKQFEVIFVIQQTLKLIEKIEKSDKGNDDNESYADKC